MERSTLLGVLSGVVIAALAATAVVANGGAENGEAASAELRAISSKVDGRTSTVMIEATEPVAYVTSQPDPLTVIVDLRNVVAGYLAAPLAPVPPVMHVDVEEATAPDGAPLARVVLRLDRPAPHKVHSARNIIYVEVDRPEGSAGLKPGPTTVAGSKPALAGPGLSPVNAATTRTATAIQSVRALPDGAGIALRGDGTLVASSIEEAKDLPPRVLLDFHEVSARGVPAVTDVNAGDIQRVRVGTNSRSPLVTRVVIDLAKQLAYRVEEAGDELRVLFESVVGKTTAPPVPPPTPDIIPAPAAPPAPVPPPPAQTTGASFRAAGALAAMAAPAGQQPAPPPPPVDPNQVTPPVPVGQTRFQGPPISMDFQGADLRAVLRTFAEISGLNIVIDPTINGTVDVSLRDVPWDQALDIILRANKLGYSVDGTVVRIAPLQVLAAEQEEQRKLLEAQALAGDLRVLTVPLSYAKAGDLTAILTRSALSARGEVQVDARTNTLIVRDLPDRLTTASELVKALDRPQPQVEIEARIVQTNREFVKQIGVQWGFNGRVDPTIGNTTPLAFPNRGSITGRTGQLQGDLQGDTQADTGINLGVPGATSAIGIALGSVNGALNLDAVLTALERNGRLRLLSTPRVSTQNNIEAEVTQGTEIPIQTVSNNTVTVSFRPAALILRVTPQITASNTVIMRIFLENGTPDFSRSINGIPPIDLQRATTTVLVADGDTTVIGGIYVSREQTLEDRVPMLHRIPLLGWLFRRDDLRDNSQELLIFITPRITRS
jgi:type IV pilus secretin PilQ/predicted competence protein